MDKYAGMNKVEGTLSANDEIVRKKEKHSRGFWKTLLLQAVIATVIGCALFGIKWLGGKKCAAVTDTVKDAVCFDAADYITELIEDAGD